MSAASLWAAAALMLNALFWGLSWWPFRQLHELGVHPLWSTALSYALAWLCIVALHPTAPRDLLRHPALGWLVLSSGLTNVGFNWAVTVGDVVRVVLLFYLMPVWAALLAWPLLGERPTRAAALRVLLGVAGVMLVLKTPETPWPVPQSLADFLALMGGFCFALTNVLLRRLHATPPAARMLAMFTGGATLALCSALAAQGAGLANALPTLTPTLVLALAALGAYFLIGNLGLQVGAARLPSAVTSVIMLSEVVFASASAAWLGAGHFTPTVLLGGALILGAALLSVLSSGHDHVDDATPNRSLA
jgi:drug/metabolite transporter (DMT)-like permease